MLGPIILEERKKKNKTEGRGAPFFISQFHNAEGQTSLLEAFEIQDCQALWGVLHATSF